MALDGSGARGAEESFAVLFGAEPRTRPGEEKASGWFLDLEQMLPILCMFLVGCLVIMGSCGEGLDGGWKGLEDRWVIGWLVWMG